MIGGLLTLEATIVRRREAGATDAYGNPLDTVTEQEVRCELQQARAAEPGRGGEFSVTDWSLFLPAGTVLETSDAVRVDGVTYEVVGGPWHVRNPRTGIESHVEAALRKA